MQTDDPNTPNQQSTTSQVPVPTPPAAPPASPIEPTLDLTANRPPAKVITIPTNAMAQIKRDEREKGKKAAQAELEDRARKAGFGSAEEMEKAAMAAKRDRDRQPARPSAQATPAPQQSASTDRSLRRAEKEKERALEEVKKANRARAAEEKRRKDAEKRVASMEAEMALRTAAVRGGVQDVDYALELLRRKIQGKTAEELRAFNEEEFFTKELRSSHPYLYGVKETLANTTAPLPQAAPPKGVPTSMPAPQPQQQGNGSGDPVDARRLSHEEYQKLLAKHGIRRPSL